MKPGNCKMVPGMVLQDSNPDNRFCIGVVTELKNDAGDPVVMWLRREGDLMLTPNEFGLDNIGVIESVTELVNQNERNYGIITDAMM